MKYFIITYGCQMNFSDSERIAKVLEDIGFKKASSANEAYLAIFNVCSIRQSAVNRALDKIKKIKKENNKLKILTTGCILQKDKKVFEKISDSVFLINNLTILPKILKDIGVKLERKDIKRRKHYLEIRPICQSYVSASVPIMTGCNNFCSYCVVPHTRGREVSRPIKDILQEINFLLRKGVKEIWLLGQNVNSYKGQNQTNKNISFAKLLEMANNIPGKFWIRFASPHPKDLTNEMIETFAKCKKVTPYLNLPAQSGNDKILKLMNRPYTIEKYRNLIKKIRTAFQKHRQELEKEIAISTDIIVGFPGETKKQFNDSKRLLKTTSFVNVFISRFSSRPMTPAGQMKDNIPAKEKKQREKELTEIVQKTSLKFNKQFLEKTIEVLVLEKKENYYLATSRHHQKTKIFLKKSINKPGPHSSRNLVGNFIKIKVIKATAYGLEGTIK